LNSEFRLRGARGLRDQGGACRDVIFLKIRIHVNLPRSDVQPPGATTQKVDDGRGALILLRKAAAGGAKLFRERVGQFQAEAAYWENRVGARGA
jgi:hypothetical protein